jgi:hypothetical protein
MPDVGVWVVAKHNGKPQMFWTTIAADDNRSKKAAAISRRLKLKAAMSKEPLVAHAATDVLFGGETDEQGELVGDERCEPANLRRARALQALAIVLPLDITQFASVTRLSQTNCTPTN